MILRQRSISFLLVIGIKLTFLFSKVQALYMPKSKSSFQGSPIPNQPFVSRCFRSTQLTMRKQKASDKRTRRLQRRGRIDDTNLNDSSFVSTSPEIPTFPPKKNIIDSPMAAAVWEHKAVGSSMAPLKRPAGGRGRSRKRSNVYDSLSSYHSEFLNLLTAEYQAEEKEVIGRIEASVNDPLSLEASGFALFDLFPERRGNIFSDEVYRLTKAKDATTVYTKTLPNSVEINNQIQNDRSDLPANHKFTSNDVIMLTLQPSGSGDFFGTSSLPTQKDSISLEARVLNSGPYYIDVAIPGGSFEGTFGPAPNNNGPSGKGDSTMRIRADRFLSNIPYTRMVAALSQMSSIPAKTKSNSPNHDQSNSDKKEKKEREIHLDALLKEVITATYSFDNPSSALYKDESWCDCNDLSRRIAKPPLPSSTKLANEVLTYIQADPHGLFRKFNGPQLSAVGAALTRRLTLIQGPPGTGKTTVASAIGFGFVHQCHNISPQAKVLACAFSNVGADNLADGLLKLGLKVIRVGKASAISESLWDYTLDAAISNDPDAQKALEDASRATANVKIRQSNDAGKNKRDASVDRVKREVATRAVKASIQACRVAATKALREADVIITTSIGAADPRLLAACGIYNDEDDDDEEDGQRLKSFQGNYKKSPAQQMQTKNSRAISSHNQPIRKNAPDKGPPLSLPFVIVDEACQSVEPANLIPITCSDSCRSVVLLGDPCQLPPTVKGDSSLSGAQSPLSVSLMSRLAGVLPHPVVFSQPLDKSDRDESYLNFKPTHQAVSLIKYKGSKNRQHISYRKRFAGSLLLSVQYRMHPSISAFSSAVFYDGLLSTPAFLAQFRNFPQGFQDILPVADKRMGVRFIDIGGQNSETKGEKAAMNSDMVPGVLEENKSYQNDNEASFIIQLLKDVFKNEISQKSYTQTIGIVTPYSAQVALLKSKMASDHEFRTLVQKHPVFIEVKSVDAYQGRERDMIIFSGVRSNRLGKIGFLKDWRRMNVALTRAKSGLIVVGDMGTLKAGDKHWEAFGKWCSSVNCVTSIDTEFL